MKFTASTHPLRSRQVDQLTYRLPSPFRDWDTLINHLQRHGFRGAVVGPHGSGKTTFLASLERELQQRGRTVVTLFTNTERGGRIPKHWREAMCRADEQTLIIADGYDVFWRWEKWRLCHVLRPSGGLLVTAHQPVALPTVFETSTTPELMITLINELYEQGDATPPDPEQLRALYRACDCNVREVIRRLYIEGEVDR